MPLESIVAKATKDTVDKSTRVIETSVKKAWSIMDAAVEKKAPSEQLNKRAMSAVQGKVME